MANDFGIVTWSLLVTLAISLLYHGLVSLPNLWHAAAGSPKEVIGLKKILIGTGVWLAVITAAHVSLNVDRNVLLNDRLPIAKRKLNVAYIPVT